MPTRLPQLSPRPGVSCSAKYHDTARKGATPLRKGSCKEQIGNVAGSECRPDKARVLDERCPSTHSSSEPSGHTEGGGLKPRLYKTRMCSFFEKQICERGDQCKFAHSPEELKPKPDFHCTKMCPFLPNCTRKGCAYAHAESELRPVTVSGQASEDPSRMHSSVTGGKTATSGRSKAKLRVAANRLLGREWRSPMDAPCDLREPVPASAPQVRDDAIAPESCTPLSPTVAGGEKYGRCDSVVSEATTVDANLGTSCNCRSAAIPKRFGSSISPIHADVDIYRPGLASDSGPSSCPEVGPKPAEDSSPSSLNHPVQAPTPSTDCVDCAGCYSGEVKAHACFSQRLGTTPSRHSGSYISVRDCGGYHHDICRFRGIDADLHREQQGDSYLWWRRVPSTDSYATTIHSERESSSSCDGYPRRNAVSSSNDDSAKAFYTSLSCALFVLDASD